MWHWGIQWMPLENLLYGFSLPLSLASFSRQICLFALSVMGANARARLPRFFSTHTFLWFHLERFRHLKNFALNSHITDKSWKCRWKCIKHIETACRTILLSRSSETIKFLWWYIVRSAFSMFENVLLHRRLVSASEEHIKVEFVSFKIGFP